MVESQKQLVGTFAAYAKQQAQPSQKRGMNRMNRKGIYQEVPKILAPSLTLQHHFL